jgi:hypothetical protein
MASAELEGPSPVQVRGEDAPRDRNRTKLNGTEAVFEGFITGRSFA